MTGPDPRRRKYQKVVVEQGAQGWLVMLDGKPMRSPAAQVLHAPNRAVAEAIGCEWEAQGERIDPFSMPVTRAACTALDRVTGGRAKLVDELAAYGATDLLLHRADHPQELAEAEGAAWDPLLDWAAEAHGARLIPTIGILAQDQPAPAMARLRAAVEACDIWRLTALAELVAISGSLVIGLAVEAGARNDEEGWRASRVDEDWQNAQWGDDSEARATAARRRKAFFEAAALAAKLREEDEPE